jgi:hypothetical protein
MADSMTSGHLPVPVFVPFVAQDITRIVNRVPDSPRGEQKASERKGKAR